MSVFTTDRWDWRSLRRDVTSAELVAHLNERMRALETTLGRWADDLEFGPVPGAYFPIILADTDTAGLATGVRDLAPISFDAIPKAVYAFVQGGDLTIDINNGSTSILTTPLVLTGTSGTTLNAASDFAVRSITPPNLNLEIDSIDDGTPLRVRVWVMLQGVTNVEDQ